MNDLSALRPAVSSQAIDAPNPVIDRAIIDAARELCGAAAIWTAIATIQVDDGAGRYPLTTDVPEAEVVRCQDPGMTPDNRIWPVRNWQFTDPRTLTVRDRTTTASFEATVSLRPTQAARSLPDVLALDHGEAVTAGALYRVLLMPGVHWSNPNLGMYYGRLFRTQRANAIAAVNRGFAHTGLRAKARSFAHFRGQ